MFHFNPKKSRIADKSSFASLPGNFQINLWTYICYSPKWSSQLRILILLWTFTIVWFILQFTLGLIVMGVALLPTITRLRKFWKEYTVIQEMAWFGCLCPAKVVSASPLMIAVYTDLVNGDSENSWPVIKIMRTELEYANSHPTVGTRIPTVAYYKYGNDNRHWADFTPIPVQILNEEIAVISECLQRLDEYDNGSKWEKLEKYLAMVQQPYTPKLYELGPVAKGKDLLDEVSRYLRSYNSEIYEVSACGKFNRPTEAEVTGFENEIGFRLPADIRMFMMSTLGGLYYAVREELWPRPKLYDVGPAWSFKYGFMVFGIGSDIPEMLDITIEYRKLAYAGYRNLVPIMAVCTDADRYCCDSEGQIYYWSPDAPDSPELLDLTFPELLMQQITELDERRIKLMLPSINSLYTQCRESE